MSAAPFAALPPRSEWANLSLLTLLFAAWFGLCYGGAAALAQYIPWRAFVELPVDLTPEQAVDAAYVLGAGRLLPIHFSRTYEHEQMYRPTADIEQRLADAAEQRDVELIFPAIGEWLEVGVAAAA